MMMRGLISLVRIKSSTKVSCKLIQHQRYCSYVPVKLASKVIIPKSGEDKSLNPIVYSHGLTGSKELWHDVPQIIADATRRLSFIYDARNHGDSEWSDEFSAEITVEDLRYFMESQNVKKAIVVGQGLGGWTSSSFALKYPHMVEMLINEDSTLKANVFKETSGSVLYYIQLWEDAVKTVPKELNEAEAVKCAFDSLYEIFPENEGLEEKEYVYKYRYPIKHTPDGYDVKHNMKAICKYLQTEIREVDGFYDGPGLFLMARLSEFYPGMEGEDIKKKFPNVELKILEGMSHNIHLISPELFIAEFLSFYKKHVPKS